jgi:type VI secretion system secreted protein VgrG
MAQFSQAERLIRLDTTAGTDVLLLESFSGTEYVSQPFEIEIQTLTINRSFKPESLLGQPGLVTIELPEAGKRYIHGRFRSVVQMEQANDGFIRYRCYLVPWIWFLSLTTDCRIFQGKTVPEIIQQVFNDAGYTDFEPRLQGSYPKRDYCVQYRESDLNFVSRLMEQEGIFYFFEHTDSKHTLVFADNASAVQPCPVQDKVRCASSIPRLWSGEREQDVITATAYRRQVHTTKVSRRDYNFELPTNNLNGEVGDKIPKGGEAYDYPGLYGNLAEADRYTKIRLEEEEVKEFEIHGASSCRSLIPGYRFTMEEHFNDDLNDVYTVVSLTHRAGTQDYHTGKHGDLEYRNTFVAVPHSVPYRPPRRAQKPVVHGEQTAVVVGKAGEEIWVDKYGRVKVQFFWDREGKKDENSSFWVRVASGLAGMNWGSIMIPRIGQEVVVSFLEGDPDRPLVTNRVYNADLMPPYKLPAEQTKSTLKSRSSKGGSASNFNEIRFEDKKGSEQVFIHAEKDMDVWVKNDRREHVGGHLHYFVKKNKKEKVEGDVHTEVKGETRTKVTGGVGFETSQGIEFKTGSKFNVEAGQEIHLKSGLTLTIETGTNLTLKVGGNFINISPAGVAIQGTMVLINSGGAAGSGSGSSPQAPEAPDDADDGSGYETGGVKGDEGAKGSLASWGGG